MNLKARSACMLSLLVLSLQCSSSLEGATDTVEPFVPPPLHLTDGFELELAAAPPMVGYPLMGCLDDRGRLFVAESDGRNLTKKEEYLRELPRFVRLLEDEDNDGQFDKSTIFADGMTMPEGGLWHNGALYIISAPYLWRLEDTDDDGVADRREKIIGYMEFDGRANQHGPYLGPNGRLYFTGGTFGYNFEGKDGSRTGLGKAAGVFSCWPDGTEVQIEGLGSVNPVDVVFTKEGELLTTCAIFDGFDGRHDALVHWVRGGLTQKVYGVPLLPESGYRLPAMSRWGQVAPGGFLRYRSTQFGKEYQDSYFACQFNTHKVVHARLKRNGATFVTEEHEFLTSPSIDFHPADIIEDADGSLLLLDTGGWLSWGCPFSKTAKPQIKGAIYRIRRTDGAAPNDPRGKRLDWASPSPQSLASRLVDRRPAVQDRAKQTLINRGPSEASQLAKKLKTSGDQNQRRQIVWTLSQMDSDGARKAIRRALADEDSSVRQAAVRSLGVIKDRAALSQLAPMLLSDEPSVRRAVATALGQIGDRSAIPWLFQALQLEEDLYLNHSLTYALIEIGDPVSTASYLAEASSPNLQRTALRVLDQMKNDSLSPSMVMPLLTSDDHAVRQEARRVIATRTEWKEEVITVFAEWSQRHEHDGSAAELMEGILLAYADDDHLQKRISEALSATTVPLETKIQILTAIGFMDRMPIGLHDAISVCLESPSATLKHQAISTVLKLNSPEFADRLRSIASNEREPRPVRIGALEAILKQDARLDPWALQFLANTLREANSPPLVRRQAARTIGHIKLSSGSSDQFREICGLIAIAGPLEIGELIRPFEPIDRPTADPATDSNHQDSTSRLSPEELSDIGLLLIQALKKSPGLTSLTSSRLESTFSNFNDEVRAEAKKLQSELAESGDSDDSARQQHLDGLLADLTGGNGSRGRAVFHGNKAACSVCHRIQGEGGTLGPDLSKIGQIRGPRDLLEAIIYPSSTLVNSFETYSIDTISGEFHSGLISRETADAVFLKNADLQEVRVRRDQIQELRRSAVSTMPNGLDKTLTNRELSDLVQFLLESK